MGNGYGQRAVPPGESAEMNRGFLIILLPAILLAIGYIVAFRYIGVTPGYGRLAGAMIVFFGGMWWLGRRGKRRRISKSN
jgi:ABC-type spermidine/putrescine transport system permease subunit II